MAGFRTLFVFSLLYFVAAYTDANVDDHDEYWLTRANEAKKVAQDAYNPNPESVTEHLNVAVRL